jgi:hypothetical protein
VHKNSIVFSVIAALDNYSNTVDKKVDFRYNEFVQKDNFSRKSAMGGK